MSRNLRKDSVTSGDEGERTTGGPITERRLTVNQTSPTEAAVYSRRRSTLAVAHAYRPFPRRPPLIAPVRFATSPLPWSWSFLVRSP